MQFDPVDSRITTYMQTLAAKHDEPVLLDMEAYAAEHDFPIVGRLVGELLELLALSIGASTVFEMGSGFGYSAYWFTRAVGSDGHVICTDGDANNRVRAQEFLTPTGRWDQIDFNVGFAQDILELTPGTFDIVYNDIDKHDYPESFLQARDRIAPGGLYICDNVLWSGRVTDPSEQDESTQAIRRHNQLVYDDSSFDTTIIPTRDGVLVARRRP